MQAENVTYANDLQSGVKCPVLYLIPKAVTLPLNCSLSEWAAVA